MITPDPIAVTIDKINNKYEYSEFMVKKLNKYVNKDFVLVVQHDGFIVNPSKWTDEFLRYDYIGAPWYPSQVHHNKEHLVGNGGFSLRSKRLCDFIASDPTISDCHPEDVAICQRYRPHLEDNGFTFAPVELARRFSGENGPWLESFGQHCWFLLHSDR
jgi:hypothetical protein